MNTPANGLKRSQNAKLDIMLPQPSMPITSDTLAELRRIKKRFIHNFVCQYHGGVLVG
jgi:hypothetical protein